MKPIRTIVILLAALVLAASCINPRPAPAPQDTSSHDITAEQFTYNGHQWIAFYHQTRARPSKSDTIRTAPATASPPVEKKTGKTHRSSKSSPHTNPTTPTSNEQKQP